MSHNKRQADETENVKRTKIESDTNDFLRLNDTNFTESDYQPAFQTIANRLINCYELVVNTEHCFRLCELEFYFYQQTRHPDTFAHRHPSQKQDSIWYFHRQGTSTTASYKAGTYKGLDITFRSLHDVSYGGILIRSIENKQSGEIYEGCCLVVDHLLNLCQSDTIKELVESKLNHNLDIFNSNQVIYIRSLKTINNHELLSSPRVGLTLKVPSIDRERFLFRSYRFTPQDYYPSKMKMTILLSLAAEKFSNNPKKKFPDYANEISLQTKTRLATVKSHLNDFQHGYEMDISRKTSPLIDYYKKKFSTVDLAKAYGIWLRKYRFL